MNKINNTGTYIYDKKAGRVIKVSDAVPPYKKDKGHTCCNGCRCRGNSCES
jgi:hypothetical protein